MNSNTTLTNLKHYLKTYGNINFSVEGGNDNRCIDFDNTLETCKDLYANDLINYLYDTIVQEWDIPSDTNGYTVKGTGHVQLSDKNIITINVLFETYNPEEPEKITNVVNDHFAMNLPHLDKLFNDFIENDLNCEFLEITSYSYSQYSFNVYNNRLHGVDYHINDILSESEINEIVEYFSKFIQIDDDEWYVIEITLHKSSRSYQVTVTKEIPIKKSFTDTLFLELPT